METKIRIKQILTPLIGQQHQNGVNDCQLTFCEIYRPDVAEQIRGKYTTDKEGMKLAKELTGYALVSSYLKDSDEWEVADNETASFGDVFANGRSIAICLGNKTFYFNEEDVYSQIPTNQVIGTLYKRRT